MELYLTSGIDGVHTSPISQYPATRIPFQHGTPQFAMDLMDRVLEYNERPPCSLYSTILMSHPLRCMTRHEAEGLIDRNIIITSYQTQKLKSQIFESTLK